MFNNLIPNSYFFNSDEGEDEEDFESVLIQENKKLKILVASLLQEKEETESKLTSANQETQKLKEDNEDLKVKSLALASQKQMLQMKYKFNGKFYKLY